MAAPANGRISEQVEGEAVFGLFHRLLNWDASNDWQQDQGDRCDHDERSGNAERADENRRDGWPGGEAEDVGGEQAAHVLAEVVGVSEDHDALDRRAGCADADAGDEPADQDGCQRCAERHQEQPGDIDEHADEDEFLGVTAVGERCHDDLRQESGDEAEPDHEPDGGLADAVFVTEVSDDREQHAVAGRQCRHQPAEGKQQDERRRWSNRWG